jgi:hypothetical protein
MNRIRKRLTYANVMSSIAVFLVLGGATAVAAKQLGRNTVGDKQLKKNAVNSSKVKDHSLKRVDFKAGQLPTGATGPQGAPGSQGPPGSDAFGELKYKTSTAGNPNGEQSFVEVSCDPGWHVVGGGIYGTQEELGQNINSSYPSNGEGEPGNTGWAGWVNNASGEGAEITALAICAKAGKVTGP